MSSNTCEICDIAKYKYCCPRCNIMYCSLACYKSEKHSNCSEDFYKEAVIAELKEQTVGKKGQSNMIDILKRFNETNDFVDPLEPPEEIDSDDEEDIDLVDRLKDINLDDGDAVWEKLTDAERQQFRNMVDNGDIMELLPKKEPWYISDESVPKIPDKIVDFSKVSSRDPAPSVRFNLVNILAAYSYMNRYFLEGYENFIVEACNCLNALSGALKQNCDYECVDIAVRSIYVEGISHQFEVDEGLHRTVLADIRKIIFGPKGNRDQANDTYVVATLFNMHSMFKQYKKLDSITIKSSKGSFSKQFNDDMKGISNDIKPQICTVIVKRLEYFLSYTKNFYTKEILSLTLR